MSNYPNFSNDYQLLVKKILERPLSWSPDQKIVYRDSFEYTYTDFYKRVKKLANMLESLGVKKGETVAMMDWDSHRYLESYFAVPMMGSILHMINIRLSPEQILYTINHAEDKVLIVHREFLPVIDKISLNFETVKKIIVISDGGSVEVHRFKIDGDYEEMITSASDSYEFPDFGEDTIATTFYTTGTTGNPKGVFFTHRQLVLHTMNGVALFSGFTDPISFQYDDVYMPITPMFHVHAWGIPYMATMLGVKQVYPGKYEPDMLVKLFVKHKVTFSHCVPTILQMIVTSPATASIDFSSWKMVIGGAALSKGLVRMATERKIKLTGGYGMSETCPILTVAHIKDKNKNSSDEERADIMIKTGFPIPFVEIRIVDEKGGELPAGKKNCGEIVVRAPWLTQGYCKLSEKSKELWSGGWLHTGDIAYRDEEGYIVITDRLKDVIKTGGEWISSLELENLISQHESVSEVAVIGVPDEKWGERPVAYIVQKEAFRGKIESSDYKKFLMKYVDTGHIEKWAVPDDFKAVDAIPKTSVGKIDKKVLRGDLIK